MRLANNIREEKSFRPPPKIKKLIPGEHTKLLFDEVRNLKERIPDLVDYEKEHGNPDNVKKWEYVSEVCQDLLEKGVSSKYFKWQKPLRILMKATSQIRSITTKPKVVGDIRDTLKSNTPIRNPIWTIDIETMADHDCLLINGGHRHVAAKQEINAGNLPQDYHYATVFIPRYIADEIKPIVSSLQAILNDHLPASGNDKNSVQKHLKEKIVEWGWTGSVIDEEKKEKILKYALVVFMNSMSPKGIKGNVTRLQNKLREQNGHVLAANPEDFVARFASFANFRKPNETDKNIAFSKPKLYTKKVVDVPFLNLTNTSINFVSTKGSVIDQLGKRQKESSHDGECDSIIEVFAAQDHGGDFDTVMKSRMSYFEDKYKSWCIATISINPETGRPWGGYKDDVVPDYFVISPQLKGDCDTSLFGKKVNILQEETELVTSGNSYEKKIPDYTIVSREELIECFKTGKAYKKEWIAMIEVQKK
jgi:hypothetical protein